MTYRIISLFALMAIISQFNNKVQADTEPAIRLSGTLGTFYRASNTTCGWLFSVERDVNVTHLGVYDDFISGFGLVSAHEVAIWGEGETPLATATVPAGTSGLRVSDFYYAELSNPIVLNSGVTYTIGAFFASDNADRLVSNPIPTITTGSYVDYLGYTKAQGGFRKPDTWYSNIDKFGPNFLMIPPEPILIALEITGPSEAVEGSSVQYTAEAFYDNDSTTDVSVSANWSLGPGTNATIDANGMLQTEGVTTPEDIVIHATYTEGEVSLQSQTTVQVYSLSGLEVRGLDEVREGCFAQYKATAFYDNDNTMDVTNSAHWWVEPTTFANISPSGLLQAEAVETPEDITVYTEYTEGNVTLEASAAVQIILYSPYIIYVPDDHEDVQAAIDASCDGDTIIVTDGIYTGDGNRDISFKGKTITLKSANGPENCIIDCDGNKAEPHRGFYFYNNEGPNTVIDGFTITNGFGPYKKIYGSTYSRGGAIHCYNNGSPTIENCIIRNNQARNGGAIECYAGCSPIIRNCCSVEKLFET